MSASSYERYEAAVNAGREPSEADRPATRDGTQERTLCPSDDIYLSAREERECERRAAEDFDRLDERALAWLDETTIDIGDHRVSVRDVLREAISACQRDDIGIRGDGPHPLEHAVARLRDGYVYDTSGDYAQELLGASADDHWRDER